MSDTPPETDSTRGRTNDAEAGTDHDVLNSDAIQWVSALVAIAGLWVVASPFVFEATDQAAWNNTMVGTAIFLIAGYNFYRLSKDRLASVGAATLVALLGLWTAISPFAIEIGSNELGTSTLVSGLLIAALSGYNAYANSDADATEQTGTRA